MAKGVWAWAWVRVSVWAWASMGLRVGACVGREGGWPSEAYSVCAMAASGVERGPRPGDALERGEVQPLPSRAPSLCPPTVPLMASSSFNGICNRQ